MKKEIGLLLTQIKNKIRCMIGKHNYYKDYGRFSDIVYDVCINCGKITEQKKKSKLRLIIEKKIGNVLCRYNKHKWEPIYVDERFNERRICIWCKKKQTLYNGIWRDD